MTPRTRLIPYLFICKLRGHHERRFSMGNPLMYCRDCSEWATGKTRLPFYSHGRPEPSRAEGPK